MGVQVRIVVYAPDEASAERACSAAFQRIDALDAILSDWRVDSELNRLCARAGGEATLVSEDLFHVVERAQALAARTRGAFDVTAGPYIRLWRQARAGNALPSPEDLFRVGARVGWEKMVVDPQALSVRLRAPGMQLDLGGIAKGYVLDQALQVLQQQGIGRALLQAGGEIVAGAPPPGQRGWRVRIENAVHPHDELLIAHAAVSSSGDTNQYLEIDGVRYSHIVDPRTGIGLTTRIAVTVVAPDGLTADSLATAISVLGERSGRELVTSMPGVAVYVRALGPKEKAGAHLVPLP